MRKVTVTLAPKELLSHFQKLNTKSGGDQIKPSKLPTIQYLKSCCHSKKTLVTNLWGFKEGFCWRKLCSSNTATHHRNCMYKPSNQWHRQLSSWQRRHGSKWGEQSIHNLTAAKDLTWSQHGL